MLIASSRIVIKYLILVTLYLEFGFVPEQKGKKKKEKKNVCFRPTHKLVQMGTIYFFTIIFASYLIKFSQPCWVTNTYRN